MHWDDYASVVGDTRIAQVHAHMSPQPSKVIGGVGVGITAAGPAGRIGSHLPLWSKRRTLAGLRSTLSAKPGTSRACCMCCEGMSPGFCPRAAVPGFSFAMVGRVKVVGGDGIEPPTSCV
jgi:hypothetical protein